MRQGANFSLSLITSVPLLYLVVFVSPVDVSAASSASSDSARRSYERGVTLFREGNADGAVDSQGRALDALRKGAQSLAEAMQQGDGDQPGDELERHDRQPDQTDPFALVVDSPQRSPASPPSRIARTAPSS